MSHRRVCVCLTHTHGAEPAVWSIYCAVFTSVSLPIMLVYFFTLYPPTGPPYCSQCLARFKKKNIFFGCCKHGLGGAARPFLFAWASFRVPVCPVDSVATCFQVQGRRRVVGISRSDQFPLSSSRTRISPEKTKWGGEEPQKTLLRLVRLLWAPNQLISLMLPPQLNLTRYHFIKYFYISLFFSKDFPFLTCWSKKLMRE